MNIQKIVPGMRVVVTELFDDIIWLLPESQLSGRRTGVHAVVVEELVGSKHQVWYLESDGQRVLYRYDEFSEEGIELYHLRWLPC